MVWFCFWINSRPTGEELIIIFYSCVCVCVCSTRLTIGYGLIWLLRNHNVFSKLLLEFIARRRLTSSTFHSSLPSASSCSKNLNASPFTGCECCLLTLLSFPSYLKTSFSPTPILHNMPFYIFNFNGTCDVAFCFGLWEVRKLLPGFKGQHVSSELS